MADVITLKALTAALSRCMAEHPPTAPEFALHADASKMADLWGPMTLERVDLVQVADVNPTIVAAFTAWSPVSEDA